jgi:hypothetical protein
LETIDRDLLRFDLALLPVVSNEWRAAKNANRLLKCVALGLPALVSATPEHVRIAEAIGLPEILLVGAEEGWQERVEAVGREYRRIQEEVLSARQVVVQKWGIKPTVDRWLTRIVDVHEQGDVRQPVQAKGVVDQRDDVQPEPLDVVILVDGGMERWRKTLRSVRNYCESQTISVVGMGVGDGADVAGEGIECHFCSDLFEMYEVLGDIVGRGDGSSVLLLRAGAELRPGFAWEVGASPDGSQIGLFAIQQAERGGELVGAPETLQDVLRETYTPPCVMIPKGVFKNVSVPLSRYGALIPWFAAIWGLHQWGYGIRAVDAPVVVAPREAMSPQPVERYWEVLKTGDSEIASELPKADDEWWRLLWVWRAAVVEDCKEAYRDHAATVIPEMLSRRNEKGQAGGVGSGKAEKLGDKEAKIDTLGRISLGDRVVRAGWRTVRKAVPPSVRERLFQRYKWTYYRYFPERQVGRS